MALAPVAYFSDPLEDYANQFIKFYEQGTVTPVAMATDSGGLTTLAKAEISGGGAVPIGFIKTAGDVIFIPWLAIAYDLWIFPTGAEADANDTSNAIQIADNIMSSSGIEISSFAETYLDETTASDTRAVLGAAATTDVTTNTSDIATNTASIASVAATIGRRNKLVNGSFDVWERGTSFTDPSFVYTADRWVCDIDGGGSGNGVVSRQAHTFGQTDVPGNPEFFLRLDQTVAGAAPPSGVAQHIENVGTLSGDDIVVSFYAKGTVGKDLRVIGLQNFGTGGSPTTTVHHTIGFIVLTADWVRYELTTTLSSVSGLILGTNGNDFLSIRVDELGGDQEIFTLDISQMQAEKGTTATPYEVLPEQEVRDLCRFYYERITNASIGGAALASGGIVTTTTSHVVVEYDEKRIIPTISHSGVGDFQVRSASLLTVSDISTFVVTNRRATLVVTHPSNTAGRFAILRSVSTPLTFIEINSEIV